ncbi:MAG: DNA translocase FtsK 4TM domain-containing protein, partial [Bacteroidales bacterium]|nr:DNA translocase FtsK 4TM domain-containing protein [Bacteroidales bacterium]
MAKTTEGNGKKGSGKSGKSGSFFKDERIKFITGILITGFAFYLFLAFVAYLIWWKNDLSLLNSDVISNADIKVKNWSGKSGFWFAKMIIGYGFGFGAFFLPLIIGTIGLRLLNFPKLRVWSLSAKFAIAAIILSLIFGFIFGKADGYLLGGPGGAQGYEFTRWLNSFMGRIGTGVLLASMTIAYLVFALKVHPEKINQPVKGAFSSLFSKLKKEEASTVENEIIMTTDTGNITTKDAEEDFEEVEPGFRVRRFKHDTEDTEENDEEPFNAGGGIIHDIDSKKPQESGKDNIPIKITRPEAGDILPDHEVEKIMENYDPKLDLSHYKFPPVTILREHKSEKAFNDTEVIENKENIIKTLADHKISIRHISATVGPTVTLYEIVPERGVRLARIKSLENDIALNLSALGIRIIAPIPGRGTVGIEVPNKNPEMVSMRSLITSKAFQDSKYDIPLALGRTITNDPYIVDLTRMPHLLVAGATGQGKSVGINAIITSILYKKHPAEIKFVLIDPKRVELPLYSKIERHFLAKIPDQEAAIITDTQKVIKTLNSLCIEMDNRPELMKDAQVRNI